MHAGMQPDKGSDLNTTRQGAITTRTEALKGIVAEFAQKAVQGTSCEHFDDKSGRRMNVTYTISQDLELFTVKAKKRGLFGRLFVKFPISAVRDIDSYEAVGDLIKT